MRCDCEVQIIKDISLAKPERLDHRQHPLGEPASLFTLAAKGVLAPQYAATQDSLGVVVCGLDALNFRERPQRRFQCQHVAAEGRRLPVGAGDTTLQSLVTFACDRFQFPL